MNFSLLVSTVKTLVALLPVIIQAVHAVEQAFGAGQGSSKLSTVLSVVDAAATAAQASVDQVMALKPAVTQLVNGLVSTFNAVGWPNASPAAAAPAQAAPASSAFPAAGD